MKIISFCIALTMWSLAMTHGYSQEIDIKKTKIELLKEKKDDIIAAERRALKQEVEIIHERLEKEELTYEEGEALKKTAAEKHALNIENKIAIIENQILLIERNGTLNLNDKNGKIFIGLGDADEDGDFIVGVKVNDGKQSYRKFDRRTYLEIVFAFGLNNTKFSL